MTFATHPERQFMQYLRGAGWIKARTLPRSVRTVKSLLQKGRIEKQHQGPKNEAFFRLTGKGLEAKKSPVPIQEQARRAEGEEMSAPRPRWTPEEDGLIRSMGASGESATAIATLLKHTPPQCASGPKYSRSTWPVHCQGRSQSGNDQSRHQSAWRCEETREPRFMSTPGLNLI
jgi:hypothetical protein